MAEAVKLVPAVNTLIEDQTEHALYMSQQDLQILQICEEFDREKEVQLFHEGKIEVGQKVTLAPSDREARLAAINQKDYSKEARVKWIGEIKDKEGIFYGLELLNGEEGKHNGVVDGVQYFETTNGANTGVFVREMRISCVEGATRAKRMSAVVDDAEAVGMHGRVALKEDISSWKEPFCVVECAADARPGYSSMPSHEYQDDHETLEKKVAVLARLIRASKSACIYSGAGLSTSSGIGDYASKAAGGKSQINKNRKKIRSNIDATPNIGHRTFAQLAILGEIENWVQQNHDGLPQKAGFPQHRLNEIHGAWFDPSNPVVPMSGDLREDLVDWLEDIEQKSDLVIAVGTSLCGMSADEVFASCCEAELKGKTLLRPHKSLGGVIIGLQQTPYDDDSYLRIYSRIDVVVALLARQMRVVVPSMKVPIRPAYPKEGRVKRNVWKVPYDRKGNKTDDESEMVLWDLNDGAKVKVTAGPGKGFVGTITCFENLRWRIRLPTQRQGSDDFGKKKKNYNLGYWWVETCVKGLWPKLPVVNCGKSLKLQSSLLKPDTVQDAEGFGLLREA